MLFTHLDSLSAENMIPDLLSSAMTIKKVCLRPAISFYHCNQLFHFSTQNIILSSKTSPLSIQDGNL